MAARSSMGALNLPCVTRQSPVEPREVGLQVVYPALDAKVKNVTLAYSVEHEDEVRYSQYLSKQRMCSKTHAAPRCVLISEPVNQLSIPRIHALQNASCVAYLLTWLKRMTSTDIHTLMYTGGGSPGEVCLSNDQSDRLFQYCSGAVV
jgi:hypothetical protein